MLEADELALDTYAITDISREFAGCSDMELPSLYGATIYTNSIARS